jgi:quercetin dioxygenase-like cupin family protein
MSDTLKLTPSESVIIRRSEPSDLEVEGIWGPGGRPPPKHFHPSQDEHFEVILGTLHARVDGVEHELSQGATLDIPAGAIHQMWNAGDEEARAAWHTRPAGRTEEWFRAIDALHREGGVGKDGMPSPLAFGVLLREFPDTFRLAVAPQPLVRPLVAALGALGRARGYGRPGAA